MVHSTVFLSILLVLLTQGGETEAKKYIFEFESDLEGWQSYRNSWNWSPRQSLDNPLPASDGNGFAIMNSAYDSDELFTSYFEVTQGASFTMSFFLKSQWEGSNSMRIDFYKDGVQSGTILDLTPYSSPFSAEWVTVSADIEPSQEEIFLAVFCYNGATATEGDLMNGCAIDQIIVNTFGEETETPTDTTAITTDASTDEPTDAPTEEPTDAPTEEPTDAPTEEPTEEPTDFPTEEPTEEPTDDPTEEPTDAPTDASTEEPTDAPTDKTTDEPTEAPTDTPSDKPTDDPTEEPTDAPTDEPTDSPTEETTDDTTIHPSTASPEGSLIYDFYESTQGWTLTNMNGASWQRTEFESDGLPTDIPPFGPWVLQIFSCDVFASTVIAQSPQLEALEETMKVQITFWMDGTQSMPSQLKVRRRQSFSVYDESPILNLDPYGDQENFEWITYTGYLTDLEIGEAFSLILEGSLGGCINNSVAVDRIVLDGVKVVSSDPSDFFDFENGLLGWTPGNMDGGQWTLTNWSSLDPALGVPAPPDEGDFFLFAQRFDIHSGVIALESPGFNILPGQRKKIHVKFWARGSVVYPAALRFRKKSIGGVYDSLPFLNLAPYGDIDNPDWISLDKEYLIPVDENEGAFQLIIEADLGSGEENMIAVDSVRIVTDYIGI